MTPYDGIDLGQYWFSLWLVAWRHQVIIWINADWTSTIFHRYGNADITLYRVSKLMFIITNITKDFWGQDQNLVKFHFIESWNVVTKNDDNMVLRTVFVDHWIVIFKSVHISFHSTWCPTMAQCKAAVTPLLKHWSYCSLALSHWFIIKTEISLCWNFHHWLHWKLS